MKRFSVCLIVLGTFFLAACQKPEINNKEAVQAAVQKYIASRGDLSLAELEITVESVNFSGDTCEAQVQFVPKGQPAASGMGMTYQLERDGDSWKVIPRSGGGHGMQMGAPPSADGSAPSGAPAMGEMPPGHPPVSSESSGKN